MIQNWKALIVSDRTSNVFFFFFNYSALISVSIIYGYSKSSGRRGGLMVSELGSGWSGSGSSPGRGHCVVFLGKTPDSHSASLLPGV